ncbi:MAG: VWA domain-containing protein [SAR324 cluster bacterium]|nr:VWA domain-containing protein [SAR324 cluster bacterium]
MKYWMVWMILVSGSFALANDSLRISQIDPFMVFFNQQVQLYVSVTDPLGNSVKNLSSDHFEISESANGSDFTVIPEITSFQSGVNNKQGILFLLLLDNSGSMYRTLEGQTADNPEERRMYYAQQAIKNFLTRIGPKDKVGLISYNSFYHHHSNPVSDIPSIETYLGEIKRPTGDEVFTELYGSLDRAAREFKSIRGRKAIILLSDGENSPYYMNTQKLHPITGEEYVPYHRSIESLQKEGISVFVIHFGSSAKDKNLKKIASETGGTVFDAMNPTELEQVYERIMNQIVNESVIQYRASMDPADRKFVRVRYHNQSEESSVTHYYFSSTVFGMPADTLPVFLFFVAPVALLMLWALSRIPFESFTQHRSIEFQNLTDTYFSRKQPQSRHSSIKVLNPGKSRVIPESYYINSAETRIGSSDNTDIQVRNIPAIEEKHASIFFSNSRECTLVGYGTVTVNNQSVTQRKLEAGDVITLGGVTFLFDEKKHQIAVEELSLSKMFSWFNRKG